MPLDLSVMVDESGSEDSRYYLVTLVFHDQAEDIATPISIYEASLRERGLDDVPFHASPLMNGHDAYRNLAIETRKRMLSAFFMMFQHMYALSKNAVVYRDASPSQYRLLQVADLLYTLELTEAKYQRHEQTATDEKVFGTHGRFKKLYLRIARRKLL